MTSVEVISPVLYAVVMRMNGRLMALFLQPGHHQTLEQRTTMKQTANITKALVWSVFRNHTISTLSNY